MTHPAANAALDELHRAEIMTTKKVERGATAYIAREVLELVTVTERRLAGTKFELPGRRVAATPPA